MIFFLLALFFAFILVKNFLDFSGKIVVKRSNKMTKNAIPRFKLVPITSKYPKTSSWKDSEAFSRSPIDIAKVKENWQICAKASSLMLRYGREFDNSISITIETTIEIKTCDAPSVGIKVTRPHKTSVERNFGI